MISEQVLDVARLRDLEQQHPASIVHYGPNIELAATLATYVTRRSAIIAFQGQVPPPLVGAVSDTNSEVHYRERYRATPLWLWHMVGYVTWVVHLRAATRSTVVVRGDLSLGGLDEQGIRAWLRSTGGPAAAGSGDHPG